MATDIISTVAWQCGNKDCGSPGGWHVGNYWTQDEGGYTYDKFSDGDHDDCAESALPSADEIEKSWRRYSEWVLANGEDPLGNFMVKRTVQVQQPWHFRFNPAIIGPMLVGARLGRKAFTHRNVPEHVREYLNLSSQGQLQDFKTFPELQVAQPLVKPGRWFRVILDHQQCRSDKAYVRELKTLARKHLARSK